MKKILLAMSVVALAATAQTNKLDGPAAQLLQMSAGSAAASRSADLRMLPGTMTADEVRTFYVMLTDEAYVDDLVAAGYDVLFNTGDIALVNLNLAQVVELAEVDYVKSISAGYEAQPMLLTARATAGVDAVHAGTDLDKAYDGTGVVCGMMDTGLDPNHANFGGKIKRMWTITGNNSAIRAYAADEIPTFSTDLSTATHGTHVLGIIGGSYKGKGKVATERNNKVLTLSNGDVNYYGVAPGAELAPCAGTLNGSNIDVAAQTLLTYAKEQGKPAVLNLSLGHNYGPHDGTTASSLTLDRLGKEMLICVSAGNEGGSNIFNKKTFTATDKTIKTCVSTSSVANGSLDLWGSDATPFKVTFQALNKNTGEVVYSYDLEARAGQSVTITGSYYNAPGYIQPALFNDVFGERGALMLTTTVSPNNNRYNVYASVQTGSGTNSSNIVPAFVIEGTEGQTVYLYGSLTQSSNGVSGYVSGNDSGTINDIACGKNIISVGAYVNKASFPTFGGLLTFNNKPVNGAIASFSSYGTDFDGRQLPLVAGPGQGMISSYSKYYVDNTTETINPTAVVNADGRESYFAEMSGTSMSSPFVAGVMALWLQADPTLTIDRVKEVLQATCVKDAQTAAAPHRFGYGKIDALAGIKYIKSNSAVADITIDNELLVSQVAPGVFDVFAAGAQQVQASLYSLNGTEAARVAAAGDNVTLSADGLTAGVYVLRATDGARTVTRKVVVR